MKISIVALVIGLAKSFNHREPNQLYQERFNLRANEADSRSYQGIILENQLKVLLIHNPDAKQSAACLIVSSGAQDDPDDFQGLAHLVEHVVIMGATDTLEANGFYKQVALNGGEFEAYTHFNSTQYAFSVVPKAFNETLEMFANRFIESAFTLDNVVNEAAVVDLEYRLRSTDLAFKLKEIYSAASSNASSFSRFFQGNNRTLSIKDEGSQTALLEKAKEHYEAHYSANLMQLVAISPDPLDKLIGMVATRFSKIKNTNIPATNSASPFGPDHLKKEIKLNTEASEKHFILQFVFPGVQDFSMDALFYVLYYILKPQVNAHFKEAYTGWNIENAALEVTQMYAAFSLITLQLLPTPENPKLAVQNFFSYLQMFRQEALNQERYEEFLAEQSIDEDVFSKHLSCKLAAILASSIQWGRTMDQVALTLKSPRVLPREEIERFIGLFTLENLRIINVTCHRGTDLHEPWFQSNYSISDMDARILDHPKDTGIHLPPVNHTEPLKLAKTPKEKIAHRHLGDHLSIWHMKNSSDALKLAIANGQATNIQQRNMENLNRHLQIKLKPLLSETSRVNASIDVEYSRLVIRLDGQGLAETLDSVLKAVSDKINASDYLAISEPSEEQQVVSDEASFHAWHEALLACNEVEMLFMGQDIQPSLVAVQSFQQRIKECPNNPSIPGKLSKQPLPDIAVKKALGSGIDYYIPLYETGDFEQEALALLAYNLIRVDFFTAIRTHQHLAYTPTVTWLMTDYGGKIRLTIFSPKAPDYLEAHIVAFLTTFYEKVSNMDTASFEKLKKPILDARADQRIDTEKDFFYSRAIKDKAYEFSRGEFSTL
ncbi:hypothetical protein DSO57_1011087 [Entomophthora muscae]|uniref:Uncharacterized protein n=1 Tax=Entomophthora muscae TaxID=34485 RepID=A0ACC2SJ96_9FUNG|nr:hypothetical protein DSO57_1011087 [Entomophthora muscae]